MLSLFVLNGTTAQASLKALKKSPENAELLILGLTPDSKSMQDEKNCFSESVEELALAPEIGKIGYFVTQSDICSYSNISNSSDEVQGKESTKVRPFMELSPEVIDILDVSSI